MRKKERKLKLEKGCQNELMYMSPKEKFTGGLSIWHIWILEAHSLQLLERYEIIKTNGSYQTHIQAHYSSFIEQITNVGSFGEIIARGTSTLVLALSCY